MSSDKNYQPKMYAFSKMSWWYVENFNDGSFGEAGTLDDLARIDVSFFVAATNGLMPVVALDLLDASMDTTNTVRS